MATNRRARVREWIAARGLDRIGEPEFAAMSAELGVDPPNLRKVIRESGVEMAPLVEGVRQETNELLARTLIALQREYETSDATRAREIRRLVITAKDHARLAARRKPEKAEMAEWMLVWLDNPPVFETWWRIRTSAGKDEEVLMREHGE